MSTRPSTRRSNTTDELHSGQYVHGDRPPAELVVDDLVPDEDLDRVGTNRPALLDDEDRLAVVEELVGLFLRDRRSTGGMPSRPGPPLRNSDSGTVCLEKSVFQPAVET